MASIKRIGKYTVGRELGQGAHSVIHLIHRADDGREYALKTVSVAGADEVKFLRQIEHEMRVAAMLDHVNLIKLYCLEKEKTWLFKVTKVLLLMEYVNGKTLDLVPAMPVPNLVDKFLQIAAGLTHMHRRGVFHADLKPNNIILARSGAVRIIDYGLAWIKGETKDRVQGTPEYMAPETAKSKVVNERTDIYNFGATMYRLATWKLPPCAIVPAGMGGGIIGKSAFREQYESPCKVAPRTPASLGKLIDDCLRYNPQERPERMSDITARLQEVQGEVGFPEEVEV